MKRVIIYVVICCAVGFLLGSVCGWVFEITVLDALTYTQHAHEDTHEIETTQVLEEATEASTEEESEPVVHNPVDNVHNLVEETEPESYYDEVTDPTFAGYEDITPYKDVPKYTQEQLEILAIIIYQEAGGDDFSNDTRYKVGSVFLNRVASPLFPDTFEEVATAERQYGSLYWTGIKWPYRAALAEEEHAVERAYEIAHDLLTSGSILPDNVVFQAEFVQGVGTYCSQDGFYFCY